jgi:hypothetical protein
MPFPKTYPRSVAARREYLDDVIARNRAREQRARAAMAQAMRDAVDAGEVTPTEMASDLNMSRQRVHQLMAEWAEGNGD